MSATKLRNRWQGGDGAANTGVRRGDHNSASAIFINLLNSLIFDRPIAVSNAMRSTQAFSIATLDR